MVGETPTSGNNVETDIWLTTRAVTSMGVEVPTPPTVVSVDFSFIFDASFCGREVLFDFLVAIFLLNLPLIKLFLLTLPHLKHIHTQTFV